MRHPKNHRYAKKNRIWGNHKPHKARQPHKGRQEYDIKGAIIITVVTVILIAAFLTVQTAEFNDCIKYGTGC